MSGADPHGINNALLPQLHFTKKICFNKRATYSERLRFLNLESLEVRRLKIDLIETFKFMNSPQNRNFDEIFSRSLNPFNQSNNLYINYSRTDVRKLWFGNRASFLWNKFNVKQAKTLTQFEKLLAENFDFKSHCRGLIHMA